MPVTESAKRINRIDLLLIVAATLIIAILSWNRDFFTYETETDFLSSFIKEAQRITNREALAVDFHPPLYPAVLSLVQPIADDWFITGRLISGILGLIAIIASYSLFKLIGGTAMARGALLAFILSPVFLTFASFATSDVFFLALFMLAFLTTLMASRSERVIWLVLSGVLLGFVLLTRTNGITHLVLLAAPWALAPSSPWRARAKRFLWLAIPFGMVVLTWFMVARITASPVWPAGTSTILALTYFSPTEDRVAGESMQFVGEQFDSLFEVIAYDPVHIAKTYFLDGLRNAKRIVASNELVLIPIGLLALPGLYYRLAADNRRFIVFMLSAVLAQLLLINLKAYETRYFLFLIPFLGAFCGYFIGILWPWLRRQRPYPATLFVGLAILLAGLVYTFNTAHLRIHVQDSELSEAILVLNGTIEQPCTLVARKPHLPFYTDCSFVNFPDAADLDTLRDELTALPEQPTYLYYGSIEKSRRRQFLQLRDVEESPEWLVRAAQSEQPRKWMLYRVILD